MEKYFKTIFELSILLILFLGVLDLLWDFLYKISF